MKLTKTKFAAGAAALVASGSVAVAVADSESFQLRPVATANAKSVGFAPAPKLSPELQQQAWAQGSTRVENPSAAVSYYGYMNDVLGPDGYPVMVPTAATPVEAKKTEPDKNTYLIFKKGLTGADASYDYGTHFLFQGHEGGVPGYLTRINLDADAAHRVTLLATTDVTGKPFPDFDGSTWEPWAKRLLFTSETGGTTGGVWAADLGVPSKVEDVSGALGRGGYEGIQNDSAGNILIVEDIGGANKPGTTSKFPNSFVYRYVPAKPGDLANGKLQALQALRGGVPITFESQAPISSPDQLALHTYGNTFATKWITVHDTAIDGNVPFNANVAAKAQHATPFKRPENGQFRPGTKFTEFYFDETGDTNATSVENDNAGGWGSVMKLTLSPSSDAGTLTMFYKGDKEHSGFDNVAFFSKNAVSFVEDAGDTLHSQRNALDSGYLFDVTLNYSSAANQPQRWLAQGRDPSATIDSAAGGFGKNDGDNEITGLHISNGDATVGGILGAQVPKPWSNGWRLFYTQQHGDNVTYEVVHAGNSQDNGDNNQNN